MNSTLNRNQEFFPPEENRSKKGCGCLGILSALFLIFIALIAAVWIFFMHTSYPLKYVANLIENIGKSSNLKISKPSGSISSGIGFKKITWDNGEISDMKFRYSGIMDVINEKLIIYEMSIGSAKIYTDSDTERLAETTSNGSDSEDTSIAHSTSKSTKYSSLKLVQIDCISLNKITIENRTTGKTIDIPKIKWTGFKVTNGDDIQFGELVADSDHLIINTFNPSNHIYLKRFEITLLPKLNDRILKPIFIDASIGKYNEQDIYDIKALDDKILLTTDISGAQQIKTIDANLADFFDAPLPNKLNLSANTVKSSTDELIITINSGSFLLGTKTFEIQPSSITEANKSPINTSISAIHRSGETEIRYETSINIESFTANLTSIPAMTPENLLAHIYHDKEFSALEPNHQEKIRKHMTWFTFEK